MLKSDDFHQNLTGIPYSFGERGPLLTRFWRQTAGQGPIWVKYSNSGVRFQQIGPCPVEFENFTFLIGKWWFSSKPPTVLERRDRFWLVFGDKPPGRVQFEWNTRIPEWGFSKLDPAPWSLKTSYFWSKSGDFDQFVRWERHDDCWSVMLTPSEHTTYNNTHKYTNSFANFSGRVKVAIRGFCAMHKNFPKR